MSTPGIYLSTTIPYINGRPHLGHALEFVQADVLARHYRAGRAPGPAAERDRRQLAEERPGRGGRGNRRGRPGQPEQPPRSRRWPARSSCRSTTSSGPAATRGTGPAWSGSGGPARPAATCTASLRGPVLHRLRAVLPARRAGRRPLPRARHRAGDGVRGELVLPPVPLRRPADGGNHLGPAADRARRPPQRGARVHRRRARGLQRVSRPRRAGPAAGASRCPATRARSSTSGGTRSATTSPRSATVTAPEPAFQRWWAGRRRADPPARQGRAPVPRGLLARDAAVRRASRCPPTIYRARLPDDRRREDQQVGGRPAARPPTRPRWPPPTARTRSAGGCCARCRGPATPTSPPERLVARANEDLANGLGNLVSRVTSMVHRYRDGVVPAAGRPGRSRDAGGGRGAGRCVRPAAGRDRGGAGPAGLPRRDGRPGRADRPGQPVHRGHRAVAAGPVGRRRRRGRGRGAGRRAGGADRGLPDAGRGANAVPPRPGRQGGRGLHRGPGPAARTRAAVPAPGPPVIDVPSIGVYRDQRDFDRSGC